MTPQEERKAINDIRLFFGKSSADTKDFFESLGIAVILSYMKGEKIVIPYIGDIQVTYKGDNVSSKGRKAILDVKFHPSEFLYRNIGQIEDGTKTDVEEILLKRLQQVFKSKM